MTENQKKLKYDDPHFRGSLDIAAWLNKDKNGNTYITIKIGQYANLFKNIKKNVLE